MANSYFKPAMTEDPIVIKPEYIFSLDAARRIATELKTNRADAAVKFFEQVNGYIEFDINEFVLYDMIVRDVSYSLKVMSNIMQIDGYNNGEFNEEKLTKLLINDRYLTRALRPTKGNETKFVYIDNQPMVTLHGVQCILRRYMGRTIAEALTIIAQSIGMGYRLLEDDLFDTKRGCKELSAKEEQTQEVEIDGE